MHTSLSHSWSTPRRRKTTELTPLAHPGTSIRASRSFSPLLSLAAMASAVSLTGVVATSSSALGPGGSRQWICVERAGVTDPPGAVELGVVSELDHVDEVTLSSHRARRGAPRPGS